MSIRIGFDDDDMSVFEESLDSVQKAPDGFKTSEMTLEDVYISDARLKFIKEQFSQGVVVNSYGDDYHLSEEQRQKNNEYYEAFKPLRRSKRKYRKLDEWIRVMREYVKAIQIIAENNQRYSPDKFMEKYSEGKIKIFGLTFPKYVGKDKKDINWEYIWTEFIGTNRDPSELVKPPLDIDGSLDDMRHRLFTEEEFAQITSPMSEEEKYRIEHLVFDVDRDSTEGVNVVIPAGKKTSKAFVKMFPEISAMIKESKRQEASSRGLNSFIHDMSMDDIEFIERYDRKHNFQMKKGEAPKFNGDMSSKNVNRYLYAMEEYLESHERILYEGKMHTIEEIREMKTREFLDEMGYNIRNCFDNREEEERIRRIIKRDKKTEKRLKRRLMAISERNKARQGETSSMKPSKKKKKSKKKESETEDD